MCHWTMGLNSDKTLKVFFCINLVGYGNWSANWSRLLAVERVAVEPATSRLWVRYSTTRPLHPKLQTVIDLWSTQTIMIQHIQCALKKWHKSKLKINKISYKKLFKNEHKQESENNSKFVKTGCKKTRGKHRATLGDHAFPVAAARAWNSLPPQSRACSSLFPKGDQVSPFVISHTADLALSTLTVSRRLHWTVWQL